MIALEGRERQAVLLGHEGYSARQITERTGVPLERLRELFVAYPATTSILCQHATCGQPARTTGGRARAGWVKVQPAAGKPRWFCSWRCVIRHATALLSAPAVAR